MINMDKIAAAVRARRGAECVDSHGACRASPEAAAWRNDLYAMTDAGATPEARRTALEPRRQALRRAGHNI